MKIKYPLVDFHSHILPSVDHGSSSVEMSLAMLKQAEKAGVSALVATPHYYAHEGSIDRFLTRRQVGMERLAEAVKGSPWENMRFFYGAEVALEEALLKQKGIDRLAIQGTNILLLEMPFCEIWQNWMYDAIYEIEKNHGVSVVVAHVDRYLKENVDRLFNMGINAQVNATALVRGRDKKRLRELCAKGCIQLIGSDAHDSKRRSYRDLALVQKKLGVDFLTAFYQNADDLLQLHPMVKQRKATNS